MSSGIKSKKLGKKICSIRNAREISLKEMADRLGIESGSLANIESGNATPSTELLFSIADELDVPVDYLLVDSLKNKSEAVDYMLYDLFMELPPEQSDTLLSMAAALMKVMKEDGRN